MTRAQIFLVAIVAFGATFLVGPYDLEDALVKDAIRKDPPPMPYLHVFEGKHEARVMTHPLSMPKGCDATINGKCYVRSAK